MSSLPSAYCERTPTRQENLRGWLRLIVSASDHPRTPTHPAPIRTGLMAKCREHGMPYQTVYNRIKKGWSMQKALTTAPKMVGRRASIALRSR